MYMRYKKMQSQSLKIAPCERALKAIPCIWMICEILAYYYYDVK